jgi:hypothetical protein
MCKAHCSRAWDRSLPICLAELVKYHLGCKLALNLKLGAEGFHPPTLVHFRQRLLEAGKSDLALRAILGALEREGFIAKRSKQRLDSTHVLGAVARLSALECVRETLALALEELEKNYRSTNGRTPGNCSGNAISRASLIKRPSRAAAREGFSPEPRIKIIMLICRCGPRAFLLVHVEIIDGRQCWVFAVRLRLIPIDGGGNVVL